MIRPEALTVRVAVLQAAPVLFDTPRTLQKLADLAADAARKGAELVVFPEAFNCGGFPKAFDSTDLSACGLLPEYAKALSVQQL